jgi:hypothetical protein
MERNGLTPESEIFTTEDTERAQRKNEADFDSKRKTAPLETVCAKLKR